MVRALRLAAGPLVLVGFFLPWTSGPGLLAAYDFSGYELAGFAGRLQALDLPLSHAAVLLGVRLALVAIVAAAVWLTLLAPLAPRRAVVRASGFYISALCAVALAIGLLRSGIVPPPTGLTLWTLGASAFLAAEAWPLPGRLRARWATPVASLSEASHPDPAEAASAPAAATASPRG